MADCGRGAGAGCRQCPPDTFSSAAGLRGCTLCRKCEGTGRRRRRGGAPSLPPRGERERQRQNEATRLPGFSLKPPASFLQGPGSPARASLSACVTQDCLHFPGRFRYLKECSSKSDAECTCKEGYRCSGDGCSRCDPSCGVGQENTGSGKVAFP